MRTLPILLALAAVCQAQSPEQTKYEAKLASKFLNREDQRAAGVVLRDESPAGEVAFDPAAGPPKVAFLYQQDAPSCHECGSIMVRNGTCYTCMNCGSTSGCS